MIPPRAIFCGVLILSLCAGLARVSLADPPSSPPQPQNQPVRGMGEVLLAATAVVVTTRTMMPGPQPERFAVDRPFLFAIADDTTGAILFLGRVSDPRE